MKPPPNYEMPTNTKPCPNCGAQISVLGGPRAAHMRSCSRERMELAVWTPEELTLS